MHSVISGRQIFSRVYEFGLLFFGFAGIMFSSYGFDGDTAIVCFWVGGGEFFECVDLPDDSWRGLGEGEEQMHQV